MIDGVLVDGLRLGDEVCLSLSYNSAIMPKACPNLRIEVHEPVDRADDPEYREKLRRRRRMSSVFKFNPVYSAPQPRSEDLQ